MEEIRAGNLGVRLAATPDEIDAALALRYRVFFQEMGAAADAEALRLRNTADARAAAIAKYREAAATFQPLGLYYETAMALFSCSET